MDLQDKLNKLGFSDIEITENKGINLAAEYPRYENGIKIQYGGLHKKEAYVQIRKENIAKPFFEKQGLEKEFYNNLIWPHFYDNFGICLEAETREELDGKIIKVIEKLISYQKEQ